MSGEQGYDGKSPPSLLPAIGSYLPMIAFKSTPENATSMSITFAQLKRIRGWSIQVYGSDGAAVALTGGLVTASGNILSIADGGSFDLSVHVAGAIYGFVWGD